MPTPESEQRARALLEQGASLYEEGRLYDALSCWKQVLALEPGNEIATEYLRFIEENFQIEVDAFIEHHERAEGVVTSTTTASPPPARAASTEPDPGASYEELDWSEILEDSVTLERGMGSSASPPVLPPLDDNAGDEDFFAQLDAALPTGAPTTQAQAGGSALAWGAGDVLNDSGVMMSTSTSPPELMPESDPLELPWSEFAAPYTVPTSAEVSSGEREGRSSASGVRRTSGARVVAGARRRDLTEMGDASIQRMLDEELSDPAAGDGSPLDLSPPAVVAQGAQPLDGQASRDLEAIVRAGMREIARAETPAPQAAKPPGSAASERRPLFSAPPQGADPDALMVQARRANAAGDFTSSLALVEQVLSVEPEHAEARRFMSENTARLTSMYRSRIGTLDRSPRIRMRAQDIMWQALDHRAGFLLSQVDGRTTFDEIIEISGLSELDATRILARLVEHGVIG